MMKKICTVLAMVAALLVAVPAQAQLHWGIRGGVNLAKASFSGSDLNSDNYTGFHIGPMVEFTMPLVGLGVDAAVLFSQTGIKASDGVESATLKRQSIEIPVNLKYNIGLGSMVGIYAAAGPQFGFGLNDEEWEGLAFKKSYLSFNVGAGVKLLRHLQAGVTYNIPLGKTAEYEDVVEAVEDAYSAKVKTWQVSVAYMF